MGVRTVAKATSDLDGLRLLALSRIPRCGGCERFRWLVEAHTGDRLPAAGLPPVPPTCRHQVCTPLVAHWDAVRAQPARRAPGAAASLQLRAS